MEKTVEIRDLLFHFLEDLPATQLRQVLDFTLFLREQTLTPQKAEERYHLLLSSELLEKTTHEIEHLEEEFANYKMLYPHKS